MISPNLLQAQVIARLKVDAPLVAALPEGENGIHERDWHSTDFSYPCVRVDRPRLTPQPNGGSCTDRVADALIDVIVASKRDSSRPTSVIMGLVQEALAGRTFSTLALRTTALRPMQMSPVEPSPEYENVWQGRISLGTVVTQL